MKGVKGYSMIVSGIAQFPQTFTIAPRYVVLPHFLPNSVTHAQTYAVQSLSALP
jgi:hypothetical protein